MYDSGLDVGRKFATAAWMEENFPEFLESPAGKEAKDRLHDSDTEAQIEALMQQMSPKGAPRNRSNDALEDQVR